MTQVGPESNETLAVELGFKASAFDVLNVFDFVGGDGGVLSILVLLDINDFLSVDDLYSSKKYI